MTAFAKITYFAFLGLTLPGEMEDPAKTLPSHMKEEYTSYIEEQHRKDNLLMFNQLLETCFDKCTEKFSSKNLTDKETDCMRNCAERTLKVTQRVGFRYSELNFQKTSGK